MKALEPLAKHARKDTTELCNTYRTHEQIFLFKSWKYIFLIKV